MDTDTKPADIEPTYYPEPLSRKDILPLTLATIAMGFPLARMLLPPFVKPGLLMPLGLLILWFVWRLTQPRRLVQTPLGIPLLINAIALVLTTAFSNITGETVMPLLFHWGAAMGVMLFLTIDMLAHGVRPRIITYAVLITISIALVYSAGNMLLWWGSWLQVWQPGEVFFPVSFRRDIIETQPNQAAMIINTGLPLVIIALWQARNRWQRLLWATWIFFAVIMLFTTSSRGGWVATIAISGTILLPLLWFLFRQRRWKSIWRTLAMSGGYVLLFVMLFLSNYRNVHKLHAGRVVFTSSPDPASSVDINQAVQGLSHSSGRDTFWRIAQQLFEQHPIFGVGPAGYSVEYYKLLPDIGYLPPHAHSIYYAFLSETGIVGSLALAMLIGTTVWVWWKGWSKLPPLSDKWLLMLGTAAAGAGLAAHGLVDIPTRQVGGTIIYLLAAGLGVAGVWRLAGNHAPTAAGDGESGTGKTGKRFHMPHPLHAVLVIAAVCAWGVAIAVSVFKPSVSPDAVAVSPQLEAIQREAAQAVMLGEYEQDLYANIPTSILPGDAENVAEMQATIVRQQAAVLAWQAMDDPSRLPTALQAQQAIANAAATADAHATDTASSTPDAVATFNQAALLQAMGQQTEPYTLLQTLVPTATRHSAAYLLLAQQHEEQAEMGQAREVWEVALQREPMLAHSAACQQSALCPTLPLPNPLASKDAALATAWQIYQQPDADAPAALWELGYTWNSVEVWAICAMTAKQMGDTHMEERCLWASRDQARMEDHEPTRQLAIAELREAAAAQDGERVAQLVRRWITPPSVGVWVPQLTYQMLTMEDRLLAETAWEAVQLTGDAALVEQCRVYRAYVDGAFAAVDG